MSNPRSDSNTKTCYFHTPILKFLVYEAISFFYPSVMNMTKSPCLGFYSFRYEATNKSSPFSTYLLQYFVCQSNCFLTIIITLMQIYISKSLATYELPVQCVKLEGCRIQHSCFMLVSCNNILIFSLIFLFDLVIVYYMFQ